MKTVWRLLCAFALASTLHAEEKDAGLGKEIGRLIDELGAQKYAVREAAQKHLLQIGDKNYGPVLDRSVRAYATSRDPEVKLRLHDIMARLVGAKLFDRPHGYLGVQIAPATAVDAQPQPVSGISVLKPVEDGVAEKAGIQAGDLILKIDDLDLVKTPSTAEFINHVQTKRPGEKVKLVIKRGEDVVGADIVLGELPKDVQADIYGDEARKQFFNTWLDDQLKALGTKEGK